MPSNFLQKTQSSFPCRSFFHLALLLAIFLPVIQFCQPYDAQALKLQHFSSAGHPVPISPRFLHFSVQIQSEWWSNPAIKVLAVFESVDDGPKGWQIAVQLFSNQPGRQMPFSTLLNVSRGAKPIQAEQIAECQQATAADGGTQTVQLEVELSPQFLYVRAKNAAKYPLPAPLLGAADLRVYFVRFELQKYNKTMEKRCQLVSELDFKETSRFALPSTTPHPAHQSTTTTTPTSTSTTTTTTTAIIISSASTLPSSTTTMTPTPSPTSKASSTTYSPPSIEAARTTAAAPHILTVSSNKLPPPPKNQWPYKMKRVKVPRRSTLAAQRFLSPNHYVPQQGRSGYDPQGIGQQRKFPPSNRLGRPSTMAAWAFGRPRATTPTPASYIDIIRDRELYEQVQRSRTMEINSRWSPIFILFMGLIAALISLSGAFALVMFVLLQCRPKPKSMQLMSHS